MIINRDAELEKNMFSKLSDIDNIMHKKDTYALGLRLNYVHFFVYTTFYDVGSF